MVSVTYKGKRFVKDMKNGYYHANARIDGRPTTLLLHRVIWEDNNGKIPDGYQVHHKDHNKDNNSIENLELMLQSEHMRMHTLKRIADGDIDLEENMRRRQQAAIKWHKSAEGRAWHSIHAKECAKKWGMVKKVCENCGCEYEVKVISRNKSRFCSNSCKSAWRRKNGLDDVTRVCACCGKEFVVNKYSRQKCCGLSCARRLQVENKKCKEDT